MRVQSSPIGRSNQIAPQHQCGPGGAVPAGSSPAGGRPRESRRAHRAAAPAVVLVDFEEHGAQSRSPRGGADADRAGGAPSPRPCQRARHRDREDFGLVGGAARHDEADVSRPLAARSAITLRSVSSCSNSCSLQPRLNEAACSAASAAASRGCAAPSAGSARPNRRASKPFIGAAAGRRPAAARRAGADRAASAAHPRPARPRRGARPSRCRARACSSTRGDRRAARPVRRDQRRARAGDHASAHRHGAHRGAHAVEPRRHHRACRSGANTWK